MTSGPDILVQHFEIQHRTEGRLLAETRIDEGVHQSFLRGSSLVPRHSPQHWIDNGAQRVVPLNEAPDAPPACTAKFAGKNVLLGLRLSEDCAELGAWLDWHAMLGFDAVLVADVTSERSVLVKATLMDAAVQSGLTAGLVTTSKPLFGYLRDGLHLPFLAEQTLVEALRVRFLSDAASVTCLTLSDLIQPEPNVLDQLRTSDTGYVALKGRSVYPWRLRKGATALFSDHIYARSGVAAEVQSWIVAPQRLPDDIVWLTGKIAGVARDARVHGTFFHAQGIAHPGVDPKELIDRAELTEDPDAVRILGETFERPPLRRKARTSALQAPGDETVIVTTMKNEGPFIVDWIAYHRAIGVDRFVVFTNDCADGTDALLGALAASGCVERHDNPYADTQKVPQRAALDAAWKLEVVKGAGWLMTLDVDEYLNIHTGDGRLRDLYAAMGDANVISVAWRMFGSGDRIAFEDAPVTEQFLHCAPEFCPRPHQAWGFKTLYHNLGLFRRLGVHRPLGLVRNRLDAANWITGAGRPLPRPQWQEAWRMTVETWGYDLATINHYAVRSAESYLVKRERGRVNHTTRDQGTAYWFRMNQNAEQDRSIRRLDAAVQAERERLMALPKVRELRDRSVQWHRDKITALKENPEYRAIFDAITSDRMRRLSRMPGRFGSKVYLAGPEVIPDEILERDLDTDWRYTITRAERRD